MDTKKKGEEGGVRKAGTRDNPKFYIRYVDTDGTRRHQLVKGATTIKEARDELADRLARVRQGLKGIESPTAKKKLGPLMDQWIETLVNRNAKDDKSRFLRDLRPHFADRNLEDCEQVGPVMEWLDDQRKAAKLSPGSIRHSLNLLSRFFSWAVERGHAEVNPVRMIPQGRRPQQAQKRDIPWIDDDAVVVALMKALPEPLNLMFYLGNRSGLRTGEIAGLRLSDLDELKAGTIRVRYSYAGPLKEDKGQTGKVKWAPAPADAEEFLGVWLKRRRLQGAGPEDLVFLAPVSPKNPRKSEWLGYRKENVESLWDAARDQVIEEAIKGGAEKPPIPATLSWYQATRHSFVTRSLKAGASLDEVSAAVGHSSPVVTRRFYDHHVRKTFSSTLTARLGVPSGRADQ